MDLFVTEMLGAELLKIYIIIVVFYAPLIFICFLMWIKTSVFVLVIECVLFHVQVTKISISLFEIWKQESSAEACKGVKVGQWE